MQPVGSGSREAFGQGPGTPAALAPPPRLSDQSPLLGRPLLARLVALSSRYPKYRARTPASPASFLGGFGCSLRMCCRRAENLALRGGFERVGWMQIAAPGCSYSAWCDHASLIRLQPWRNAEIARHKTPRSIPEGDPHGRGFTLPNAGSTGERLGPFVRGRQDVKPFGEILGRRMISIGNALRSHAPLEHMRNRMASFAVRNAGFHHPDSLPHGKTLIRLTKRGYPLHGAEIARYFY